MAGAGEPASRASLRRAATGLSVAAGTSWPARRDIRPIRCWVPGAIVLASAEQRLLLGAGETDDDVPDAYSASVASRRGMVGLASAGNGGAKRSDPGRGRRFRHPGNTRSRA